MQEDLEQLKTEVAAVLTGLDAQQTQLRPKLNDNKWNIQQIVRHLLMSYERTCEVMDERIQKGRPTRTEPTLVQRVGQLLVIKMAWFPPGRKAPAAVMPGVPTVQLGAGELQRNLDHSLSGMHRALVAAEELFGQGRCASHIVLGPLAISQWRRFHLVHGRHHIKQILEIRRDHAV